MLARPKQPHSHSRDANSVLEGVDSLTSFLSETQSESHAVSRRPSTHKSGRRSEVAAGGPVGIAAPLALCASPSLWRVTVRASTGRFVLSTHVYSMRFYFRFILGTYLLYDGSSISILTVDRVEPLSTFVSLNLI